MMMSRGYSHLFHFLPIVLAVLALLCSLCFSFLILPYLSGPLAVTIDPDKLGELGRNLSEGRGYSYGAGSSVVPAFDRAPVYPLLVMILTWITGGNPLSLLQIFQGVFHGLTGLLLFKIGMEVWNRRTALLAQAIHGVHPIMIWYTARIWIETTNTLLITALVFTLLLLWKRETKTTLIVAIALFALTVLTKSVILFLPVVIFIFALLRKQWTYARSLVLVFLIGLLLIAPWTMRNYLLSGRWVLVHTSLGLNLVQGEAIGEHWPQTPFSTLAFWEKGREHTERLLAPTGLRPESPGGDIFLTAAVLQRWRTDPGTLVRHIATNAITFWYLSESPLKSGVVIVMQCPLLILALWGMRMTRSRGFSTHVLLVTLIAYWIVHAMIVGWLRYSVPALPLMILFAAAAVERFVALLWFPPPSD